MTGVFLHQIIPQKNLVLMFDKFLGREKGRKPGSSDFQISKISRQPK
jgi:hypothetical protein